jgi:hypothetical protein
MLRNSTRITLAAFVVGIFFSGAVNAQSWRSEYLPADRAGLISVCTAGVEYSDSMFLTRVYGDTLDFMFFRVDFTLPWDTLLGTVIVRVDGNPFQLRANTPQWATGDNQTSDYMFLVAHPDDVGDLIDLMALGSTLDLEFPNGAV